jgi:methylmalonyl-CoA mutase C-terminal domain/subunit
MAKTSLDGHWRGVTIVERALREARFEVIALGMATPEEIVRAAVDEQVDVVGLNLGGRCAVVERIVGGLRSQGCDAPVMVGGVVTPQSKKKLEMLGLAVFPPGSSLEAIVATADRLCSQHRGMTEGGQ